MTAATADLLVMPGVRMLTARRLPLERRRELLRELARAHLDMEPENVELQLAAWAHESLTGPALKAAWLEYRYRLELAADAAEGRLHWSLIDPEMRCGERQQAAVEIAADDAEEALNVLAGGTA